MSGRTSTHARTHTHAPCSTLTCAAPPQLLSFPTQSIRPAPPSQSLRLRKAPLPTSSCRCAPSPPAAHLTGTPAPRPPACRPRCGGLRALQRLAGMGGGAPIVGAAGTAGMSRLTRVSPPPPAPLPLLPLSAAGGLQGGRTECRHRLCCFGCGLHDWRRRQHPIRVRYLHHPDLAVSAACRTDSVLSQASFD